jgi:hypothetical protein
MEVEAAANELRLNWSVRGLAYLLSKHGIEWLIPTTSRDDGMARVELRVLGTKVKEVQWTGTDGSARHALGTREG